MATSVETTPRLRAHPSQPPFLSQRAQAGYAPQRCMFMFGLAYTHNPLARPDPWVLLRPYLAPDLHVMFPPAHRWVGDGTVSVCLIRPACRPVPSPSKPRFLGPCRAPHRAGSRTTPYVCTSVLCALCCPSSGQVGRYRPGRRRRDAVAPRPLSAAPRGYPMSEEGRGGRLQSERVRRGHVSAVWVVAAAAVAGRARLD
jgi:hypothetical protein